MKHLLNKVFQQAFTESIGVYNRGAFMGINGVHFRQLEQEDTHRGLLDTIKTQYAFQNVYVLEVAHTCSINLS